MRRYLLYGFYTLVILLVGAAMAFKIFQPVQVVPRIRLAPGFSLIDQDGQRLTNEDLRGKFVIYTFSYTRCPAPCYQLDQTMLEIQQRLNEVELGDIPVAFVTISFDPAYDTPAVLRAYADGIGADTGRWRFATASDPALLKHIVGGGFEVYYQPKDDGSFAFDPRFVLVDGWGIIRGQYRYRTVTPDTDRILRHLGVLAAEVRNSKGAATLAYEAAHLFLCYTP